MSSEKTFYEDWHNNLMLLQAKAGICHLVESRLDLFLRQDARVLVPFLSRSSEMPIVARQEPPI